MDDHERGFRCGGCQLSFRRYSGRVDKSRKHFALGLLLQDDRRMVMEREIEEVMTKADT